MLIVSRPMRLPVKLARFPIGCDFRLALKLRYVQGAIRTQKKGNNLKPRKTMINF